MGGRRKVPDPLVAEERLFDVFRFTCVVQYVKSIQILTVFVFMCFGVRGFHLQLEAFKIAKWTALILFEGTHDHLKLCNFWRYNFSQE